MAFETSLDPALAPPATLAQISQVFNPVLVNPLDPSLVFTQPSGITGITPPDLTVTPLQQSLLDASSNRIDLAPTSFSLPLSDPLSTLGINTLLDVAFEQGALRVDGSLVGGRTNDNSVDPLLNDSTAIADGTVRSIAFIDPQIPNYNEILAGLRVDTVVLLDGTQDGVTQITAALKDYSNLSSVHIFSEGQPGQLQLGSTKLEGSSLDRYQADLQSWGKSLSPTADLLLYGCRLAGDAAGKALVDQISSLTGADVAASDDLTGAASLGGDWVLEYLKGSIESYQAVQPWVTRSYNAVFAPGTTFALSNFANVTALQLNGNASQSGTALRLTPAVGGQVGSAFYKDAPIAFDGTTSFNSQFQFRLGGGDGTAGADGFAFVLAPNTTSLGGSGGSVGYLNSSSSSFAIKFDSYQNPGEPSSNFIATLRDGTETVLASATTPLDLNGDTPINAWVEYNGTTNQLQVFLSSTTTKPTTATLTQTIDLAPVVGPTTYAGFAGGTGGLSNNQDISSWSFTSTGTTGGNGGGTPAGTGTGLAAVYYDNIDFTGPTVTRTDATVNFDWGTGSPAAAIQPDTFSAIWNGQVEARFTERYTFQTTSDDGVRLWVNGQQLVDRFIDQAPTAATGSIDLVAGQKYNIRMEYYEKGGGAVSKLAWSSASQAFQIIPASQLYPVSLPPAPTPGNGTGLQGTYYDNIDFTAPKLTRTDETLNFNWGNGSPDPQVGPDSFSVQWRGQVQPLYSETYNFRTTSDDGIRLKVNGVTLVDKFINQAPTIYTGSIALVAGQKYDIEVDYYESGGGAVAQLGWSSSSQPFQIIPKTQLYAPVASTGAISLAAGGYSVSENAGSVAIGLVRSGSTAQAATVDINLVADTASSGQDYQNSITRVTIPAGASSATFNIPIVEDTLVEGDERFAVTILSPVGAGLGAPRTATVTILDNDGNGNGLRGEYYNNIDLTDLKFNRTDATANFDWGTGSPSASIDPDTFSVRWTGQVLPEVTGSYTFRITGDDGVRLYINNNLLINGWFDQAPSSYSGTINLVAGQRADIRFEYYEKTGGALAKLEWQPPGQALQVIPQSRLFSPPVGGPGIFEVSTTALSVDENGGSATISVNRVGGADGAVSVGFGTVNGTAVAGSDFVGVSGTLNFAAGQTSQTITIPITNDTAVERNETLQITLRNPTGGSTLSTASATTVRIIDNDPGNFTQETLFTNLNNPTSIDWSSDGQTMFIAEKDGIVYAVKNGVKSVFIDINREVNSARDRGLNDIAIHPDFGKGLGRDYVYLLYTYDPPQAANFGPYNLSIPEDQRVLGAPDGKGNRPSRLLRVTANPANLIVALPETVADSREVILGKNSIWDYTSRPDRNSTPVDQVNVIPPSGIVNANGQIASANGVLSTPPASILDGQNVRDYLTTDSESHSIGSVEFGPDGKLYVSNGDGASYNVVDKKAVRVQDLNNLSGKILRIDPITGQGLTDNPFYQSGSSLDANRSKVYDYGLRNPFRFTFQPSTGNLFVGDVGWFSAEEINTGRGQNFGWPYFEGPNRTIDYQLLPEAQAFYASGQTTTAPFYALNRVGFESAILAGDFYTGTTYPSIYNGGLTFVDYSQGQVNFFIANPDGTLDPSPKRFATNQNGIVQIIQGPDNVLYSVNIGDFPLPNTGSISRWKAV